MTEAPYRRIMAAIRAEIAAGRLGPGDRVPSEHALTAAFGVSRMTANRALRELAAEGLIQRRAGSGSFVAQRRMELSLLEIPDISEEIRAAGGRYSCRVIARRKMAAPAELARAFELGAGATLLHTLIVHQSDGRPIQLEDRHVDPAFAPAYLDQDFARTTPNAYLMTVARPEEAEQVVEAQVADLRLARLLGVARGQSCLSVIRRTWCGGRVATRVRLTAPGERWRLRLRFRL